MRNRTVRICGYGLVLLVVLAGGQAMAVTSSGSGYWTNPLTWGGELPLTGSDVTIQAGHTVTADVSAAGLNSLTVSGTLVFSGWETVITSATITVGGTVSHLRQTATETNAMGAWVADHRVRLVCVNLHVPPGGQISASGRGFMGGTNSSMNGAGPAGGTSGSNPRGGNYGSSSGAGLKAAYGSMASPEDPGSGGGADGATYPGGHAGGVIRIEASGQVTVDGAVAAQGNTVGRGGGGSGGSILIECQVLAGAGIVSVAGGRNTSGYGGSGGGGGRVAVTYSPSAQAAAGDVCRVLLSARCGWGGDGGSYEGVPGTLFLTDGQFFPYTNASGNFAVCTLGATTAWARASLTMTNGYLWMTGVGTGVITQAVVIRGYATTKAVQEQPVLFRVHTDGDLSCASAIVTNGGVLGVGGGAQTAGMFNVGSDIDVFTNSALYVYAGPTHGFAPRISARRVKVRSGGVLSGTGRGYGGRDASGGAYGPGAGGGTTSGGGHGGVGGGAQGGGTYGSSNAPVASGSGGGGSASWPGGWGGSVVDIACSQLTVDGQLTASGGNGNRSGGGAGGSVWIRCSKLMGSGTISAAGGSNYAGSGGAGGGGGRIAMWYVDREIWSGSLEYPLSVAHGTGEGGNGQPGTLVWRQVPASGTVVLLR